MKRILAILFVLALAGADQAWALGLGAAVGQETLHLDVPKVKGGLGSTDLNYNQLDVTFNVMKFSLLDLGRPLATGLYGSSKSGDESFWNRRAAIGDPEKDTQWLGSSTELSYIMGSSTGAKQILSAGAPEASPAPSSTNSFWGIDLDMVFGQYQFLKLPLELSLAYDVQFRSYTITNVYDGAVGKLGETGGFQVNGFLSLGADLGIIPGLVVSARAGYDPMMSAVSAIYPDLTSPGYRLDGGVEWMPLKFISGFIHYEQMTTGFFGISRPTTMTDISFGGRFYFF